MKNNIVPLLPECESNAIPRNRLIRLYNRLREKGGWRAVARERGCNQQYLYNFAIHGVEPHKPDIRKACFLPASSRQPRPVKPHPETLTQEWWDELRSKAVRSMAKQTRNALKVKS